LLVSALLGLPLLAAWIWFATRRALAPIDAIADQVRRREPQHLGPLTPPSAPTEIRPLLGALNGLLARVDQALESERRFTADAAHELRTPLAALGVQASVAARARDTAERDHALAQIAAGTKRASHLVEQLLTLARLDPNLGITKSLVRLDELAAEVCADQAGAALAKGIQLELDAGADARVMANADLLRILLRNLVDNALRYSPVGGQVLIALGTVAGKVRLTVSDNGPGIPDAQRARALERFHRLVGQETEGSGLGLSIVARIAEQHGAGLTLEDGLGGEEGGRGLQVVVQFETNP
ncbi:MAG: ATP-binding protein, partial [Chromatiaceae bacterium]